MDFNFIAIIIISGRGHFFTFVCVMDQILSGNVISHDLMMQASEADPTPHNVFFF